MTLVMPGEEEMKASTLLKKIILLFITCSLAAVQPLISQEEEVATVRLISANKSLPGEKRILAGLKFRLKPGWKITAPGQTGAWALGFPEVDWKGSGNLKQVHIQWPQSKTFIVEDIKVQGYEGDVLLPLEVEVKDPSKPLVLFGLVKFTVCSVECRPFEIPVTLTLAPGTFEPSKDADQLLAVYARKEMTGYGTFMEENAFLMLLLAFLGGVILNFMPCVLPVLSIKMMGLARKAKRTHHIVSYRASFWATTLGILSSFLLLALLVLILDALGETAGWGLHFQQPSFLIFMIMVLGLFSFNLLGFFEVVLPQRIHQHIDDLLGDKRVKTTAHLQDFLTGAFATLLATPCTAPFLGTALGYAFSRSGVEIILFFLVMGAGFSAPYWVAALLPPEKLKLPKPGPWMLWLERVLGGLLGVTALWLLWVFAHIEGFYTAVAVMLTLLVVGVLLYGSRWIPRLKAFFWTPILLMFAVYSLDVLDDHEFRIHRFDLTQLWQPFDRNRIQEQLSQHKKVVVNMTADWCLTCQINDLRVFATKEGKKLLKEPEIFAMRGDWTKHNPEITQFLKSYQRGGIPFTIVFTQKHPQGKVLSELLSLKDLQEALRD